MYNHNGINQLSLREARLAVGTSVSKGASGVRETPGSMPCHVGARSAAGQHKRGQNISRNAWCQGGASYSGSVLR